MQRFKLVKLFKKNDWYFLKHGGNHDIWTNGNEITEIPRHPQIRESLARGLIKKYKLK